MGLKKTYKRSVRRDRVELVYTLLESISDGYSKPTQIMYCCGMSWDPTKKLLKDALERNWIEKLVDPKFRDNRTNCRYQVTDQGRRIFRLLEQVILEVYPLE